jgi:nodulation protein E
MSKSKAGRRVVVTGFGVVTPIGTTVDEFWAGLKAGKSGVSALGGFPLDDLKILIAAQIKDFDPKQRLKHFKRDRIITLADRYSWFAAAAATKLCACRASNCRKPIPIARRASSVRAPAASSHLKPPIATSSFSTSARPTR